MTEKAEGGKKIKTCVFSNLITIPPKHYMGMMNITFMHITKCIHRSGKKAGRFLDHHVKSLM